MTEDEAKTKWCPFARVSEGACDGNASNRCSDGDTPAGSLFSESMCVASACMAWRVVYLRPEEREKLLKAEEKLRRDLGSSPLSARDGAIAAVNKADVGDGYCGLAGRPA